MYEDCLDFIYENEYLKAKKPFTSTEVEGKRFRYFVSLLEERNLGKVLFSRFSLLEKVKEITNTITREMLSLSIVYLFDRSK